MDTRTRAVLLLALTAVVGSRTALAQAPAAVTPALIAQGDSIFHSKGNCYACHGANAQGAVGPNLTDAEWIHSDGSYDAIVKQVTTGVPQNESKSGIMMPPKGGSSITDDEVKAVAAYVYSLSHKTGS
ncbi:MAG TPA: c-type cytochrome [Gemmatimonadales bacterium]|jgi:mono/diheme cytochrome c family protein|nr:c-type cytochrome [Gemmatimonadales bacterium]